jgi:hypothetical protein
MIIRSDAAVARYAMTWIRATRTLCRAVLFADSGPRRLTLKSIAR